MEIQDLILIFWLNFSAIFNQDPSSLPQRGSEIHINVLTTTVDPVVQLVPVSVPTSNYGTTKK